MKNLRRVGIKEPQFIIFTDGAGNFSSAINLTEGSHTYSVFPYMLSALTEKELIEKCFVSPKRETGDSGDLEYQIENLTSKSKADIVAQKETE